MGVSTRSVSAILPGRDEVHLTLEMSGDAIAAARLRAIGCPALLQACRELRAALDGPLLAVPIPQGNTHEAMLLRELLLKARGEWSLPYREEELCHCRAVSAAKVDAAIVGGAHDVGAVNRRTSAGTSCGGCQPDIQALLEYRKAKPA